VSRIRREDVLNVVLHVLADNAFVPSRVSSTDRASLEKLVASIVGMWRMLSGPFDNFADV